MIKQNLGVNHFRKAKKECDILPLVMETPNRKAYLEFTNPYIIYQLWLWNIKSPFIDDLNELKNKTIGVSKDYAYHELLKSQYPNINFVEVKNANDGLKEFKKKILWFIGTFLVLEKNSKWIYKPIKNYWKTWWNNWFINCFKKWWTFIKSYFKKALEFNSSK